MPLRRRTFSPSTNEKNGAVDLDGSSQLRYDPDVACSEGSASYAEARRQGRSGDALGSGRSGGILLPSAIADARGRRLWGIDAGKVGLRPGEPMVSTRVYETSDSIVDFVALGGPALDNVSGDMIL